MGVSTNAVLFYGYCWDEEGVDIFNGVLDREDGRDSMEWEEVVLRRRGMANPWDSAPADLDQYLPGETYEQKEARIKAWTDANRAALELWYTSKNAVRTEFGVDVGYHCSGSCPMPYLSVRDDGAGITARRGYPEEVDPAKLVAPPEWAERLHRFMAEFCIERPQPEPRWWLVSWWC